jgi:hypothetical protein
MKVEEAYKCLEDIIMVGFLSSTFNINGKQIALKTLNELEYRNIEYYTPTRREDEHTIYRLVFSTFMVDGYNTLVNRDKKVKELYCMYQELPVVLFSKLVEKVKSIHNRYLASLKYLEGFSYTNTSRYLWKSLNQNSLASEKLTGIEGTGSLGINSVQNNWVAINKKLDSEEDYERDFNLSVLVASAMNSKGARGISRSYEAQKTELKELRDKIAEYGYDEIRYEKERSLDEWSKPIKSRQDIVRELEKQVKGEKDKHDLFIEEWIEKQKKLAEEAKKSVEEKQVQYRKKMENIDPTKIEGSRIATPEEIEGLSKGSVKGIRRETLSREKFEKQQTFIKKVSSVVLRNSD